MDLGGGDAAGGFRLASIFTAGPRHVEGIAVHRRTFNTVVQGSYKEDVAAVWPADVDWLRGAASAVRWFLRGIRGAVPCTL